MNEEKWIVIKQFYLDNFNIPGDLVDLLADSNILTMCVSGSSNESISKLLDIDIESVKQIIKSVFEFDGWEKDLDINPLSTNTRPEDLDDNILRMLGIYDKIMERLDRWWV